MRRVLLLAVIGPPVLLSGCGGGSSAPTFTPTPPPSTYSIGGTVAGLSGTVVLQDNGSDNLSVSRNGAFAFSTSLQPNATYDVTVASQPAGQVCTVNNGKGTATAAVSNIGVVCSLSMGSAADVWTWAAGANSVDAVSVYGTQGTGTASTTPGARRESIVWTDSAGNFWLFGGSSAGDIGMLDDLWQYSPSTQQWVWQGGSTTVGAAAAYGTEGTAAAGNNPGGRESAARWTDAAGNLWLFGGDNLTGQNWQEFNDLWSYNPASGLWTWVGGSNSAGNAGSYGTLGVAAPSNLPPARTGAASWVDSAGVFWLFGGLQLNANGSYHALLNDLWSYNPATGLWTWVAGSDTPNASGVYGTPGVAAAANIPGARTGSSVWLDSGGDVWLFGGSGLNSSGTVQEYNDLWEYNPASGLWTWVSGSNLPDALGVYGTPHAGTAGSEPGARVSAVAWSDRSGNLWLFGGYGYGQTGSGTLNDLWEYSIGTGEWTWIGGSSSTGAPGAYGTKGVPAVGNAPGARQQAAGWTDSSGNFWLFGGLGVDSSGVEGALNDLWSLTQGP